MRNYGLEPAFCALELSVAADFADLFEVKEGRVEKVGRPDRRTWATSRITWTYRRGHFSRGAHLDFSRAADAVDRPTRVFEVIVPAGGEWSTCLQLTPVVDDEEVTPRYLCGRPVERSTPVARGSRRGGATCPTITTDHDGVQRAARPLDRGPRRAAALRSRAPRPHRRRRRRAVVHDALRARQPAHVVDGDDGRLRPRARHAADAGALPGRRGEPDHRGGARADPPRDALRRVGRALARRRPHLLRQRRRHAAVRDAARRAAALGQSTRGGRRAAARRRPRARRGSTSSATATATATSSTSAPTTAACENQGWKDSHDSTRFADGRLAEPPIALCEVQGYVYAALIARSHFATEAGDDALRRASSSARAADLKARFNRDFWLEEQRLARDGSRPRQAAARRADVEHGPLPLDRHPRRGQGRDRRRAPRVRRRCSRAGASARSPSSMTGYNPISYHNGSVWPHDNAICAAGLMRYGFVDEAHRVMEGIVDAARVLREPASRAVRGAARAIEFSFPVSYPTSCSPQAWAAASPLLFLRSMLHFDPDVRNAQLHLAPDGAGVDRPAHARAACRSWAGTCRSRSRATGAECSSSPTASRSCPRRAARRDLTVSRRGRRR